MSSGDGPVSPRAEVALRPLPLRAVRLAGSLLGDLQVSNGSVSIPMGAAHLDEQGAWENYRTVAEAATGVAYHGPNYEDGEAYKWLEAVAWEAGRSDDPRLPEWLESRTALIAAAQADDGYLGTFVQSGQRQERYGRLDFDHEIFNMGAMIQSAVAQYRATGRTGLLDVARRAADHLSRTFGRGDGQREGCCGHPVAELALVELYRTTGERRYLELAAYFVHARGHMLISNGDRHRAAYLSDRSPVRDTAVPEGHAVRAVYLAAGATDVAIETGDADLLARLEAQWEAMVRTKMYITGGLGSRWDGESFGNPYELPSDVAYAETCAAVASLQWSWRLLLATGRARYADLLEWQLYNAILPGVSADWSSYFYVNALQVRTGADDADDRAPSNGRQPWFRTSCCPTNLMRTFASLNHYVATRTASAIQIHQYAAGSVEAELDAGLLTVSITTDYPVSGEIVLTVDQAPAAVVGIHLRIPSWARGAEATVHNRTTAAGAGGYLRLDHRWQAGDRIVLRLPVAPRLVHGHPRVEEIRGSVTICRGPLLYAVEQVDQEPGVLVDDLVLTGRELAETPTAGGPPTITAPGAVQGLPAGPYADEPAPLGAAVPVRAVPYHRWANRGVGAMKVWLPFPN